MILQEKMLFQRCFNQEGMDHYECATRDKRLFKCICCNEKQIEDCKSHFYHHAFNIHKNHTKQEFDEYGEEYYDDEDDDEYTDASIYIEELKNNQYDDVNITDISHLYDECKERQYLPLHCFVKKNHTSKTYCDCSSDALGTSIDLTMFNSTGLWNDHACDVTYEQHTLLRIKQSLHNLFYLCMLVMIFFGLSLVVWYVLKKMKKPRFEYRIDDEIPLVPRDMIDED